MIPVNRELEHRRLLAACRTYIQVAEIGIPPGGEHGLLLDIRAPLIQLCPLDDSVNDAESRSVKKKVAK